jgi:hypothetical protein
MMRILEQFPSQVQLKMGRRFPKGFIKSAAQRNINPDQLFGVGLAKKTAQPRSRLRVHSIGELWSQVD